VEQESSSLEVSSNVIMVPTTPTQMDTVEPIVLVLDVEMA
jgi:hypothetical protein